MIASHSTGLNTFRQMIQSCPSKQHIRAWSVIVSRLKILEHGSNRQDLIRRLFVDQSVLQFPDT